MLRRKMLDRLNEWRSRPGHRPLIVKGQKQVGKTFIIREFGKNYGNLIELNFIERPSLKDIFDDDLRTETVISRFTQICGEIHGQSAVDQGRRIR